MKKSFAGVAIFLLSLLFASCSSSPKKDEPKENELKSHESKEVTKKESIPESQSKDKVTSCKLKHDERKIEIVKNKNSGCNVLYTKFGKTKPIANSIKKDGFYCTSIFDKVKRNLVEAGFVCK